MPSARAGIQEVQHWSPPKPLIDFLNHNRPIRYLKNVRNRLLDAGFRKRGKIEAAALVDSLKSEPAKNLCFTIAFNTPWALEILLAAWHRYPTNLELVVANNSSDLGKRAQISTLCRTYKIHHTELPRNPEWNPNRSHGIAMNWVYYNVIKRLKPQIFGFIDYDCFPICPHDIINRMANKSVYGVKYPSRKLPNVWNLWAGFCFYRFAHVENYNIDFKHRVEFGLDTGGGNWQALYRLLDEQNVTAAEIQELKNQGNAGHLRLIIDNAFSHIGSDSFMNENQRAVSDKVWDEFLGGKDKRIFSEF